MADDDAAKATRWVERGVGYLRLLLPKAAEDGAEKRRPRVVMRVENVGRLILNAPLLPTTAPAQKARDRSIRLVLVNAQEKLPPSYLLRVREPKEADDLLQAITENIKPAAE